MRRHFLRFVPVLILALGFALSHSAFARLGENEKTIEQDRAAMRAVHTTTSQSLFRVHEISTSSQTVHEYARNDGTVFAVTWRGIGTPDLSQLFGSYYQEYRDADSATPRPAGRAPKVVRSSNLVVRRFGHMGDIQGKAYIPALMPSGVTVRDLR